MAVAAYLSMKARLATALVVVLAQCATTASAQAGTPHTRAEVKAETRSLVQARTLTPASESASPYQGRPPKSSKTIEDRNAETLAARRSGELRRAGDAADLTMERRGLSARPTRTRTERKSETRAAAKAHQLTPAGEGADAPRR